MRDDLNINLGLAPSEYDSAYFNDIVRQIEIYVTRLTAVGPIRVSTVNISNLPTSATGLRTGDLWNDAGTVRIVT